MPIVPEKRQLGSQVQGALGSQFWSQGVQSVRSLTGRASTVPCEPQPLPLCTPAGLSRTQFLVATQAAGLPLFPAYAADQGGVVADRVLVQSGGPNWWAALVGRTKLQRAIGQRHTKDPRDILQDPDNYALGATSRVQVGSDTVFHATLLADDLKQIPDRLNSWLPSRRQNNSSTNSSNSSGNSSDPAPLSASSSRSNLGPSSSSSALRPAQQQPKGGGGSAALQLKQRFERLELTADLGLNAPEAEGTCGYRTVPLTLSLDVGPRSSSKQRWLHYRLGVRSALAPLGGVPSPESDQQQQQQQQQQAWHSRFGSRLHSHLQGALAMQGEATLWQAGQKPWQGQQQQRQGRQRNGDAPLLALPAAKQASAGTEEGEGEDDDAPVMPRELEVKPLTVEAPLQSAGRTEKGRQALPRRSSSNGTSSSSTSNDGSAGGIHGSKGGSKGGSGTGGAAARTARTLLSRRSSRLPLSAASASRSAGGNGSSNGSSSAEADGADADAGPLITPAQIQDALQGSAFWLERLRTELQVLAGRVDSGDMRRRLGQQEQAEEAPAKCWSSFLPAPHVKVSGLIGALTRVPLAQQQPGTRRRTADQQQQQQALPSPTKPSSRPASRAASTQRLNVDGNDGDGGVPPTPGRMARLRREVPSVVDRLLLQGLSGVAGAAKGSAVRAFASGGVSMQLGEMRRPLLDFTRLEARVDLGLTSARGGADANSSASGGSSQPHYPAFALEQRGVWHALTLSLSQQLLGPVRLCGDFRFALDSEAACPRGRNLLKPAAPLALAKHVVGMRPSLIEHAFGADVVVPGSQGLARLVAWYAPLRKEAMLELRLM